MEHSMLALTHVYNDHYDHVWVVVATMYDRHTLQHLVTYDVMTCHSFTYAFDVVRERSESAEIQSAYGTWGCDNIIATFSIQPRNLPAYPNT